MTRKCKCKCGTELAPVSKCEDIVSKKGYASIKCSADHAKAKRIAKAEKEVKQRNIAFKKSVRKRTGKGGYYENLATNLHYCVKNIFRAGEPCYTCGQEQKAGDSKQAFHVGHFMAAKMVDPRRFMLENLRIQCYRCNVANSGKHSEYRLNMIKEMGIEHVEWLECSANHKELKEQYPDIEDIRSETARYNKLKIEHKRRIG